MARFHLRRLFRRNSGGLTPGGRRSGIGITLSTPMCIVIGAGLVCAIAWAFFMGLMIGRGQNPETRIQEMTEFLRDEDQKAKPVQAETPPQAAAEAEKPAAAAPVSEAAPAQVTQQQPAKEPAYPFAKPSEESLGAWGVAKTDSGAAREAAPQKKETKPAPAVAEKKILYDYVFQIAVFKNSRDAENLGRKLAGMGLRANVKKSGKVFLVLVNMRDDEKAPAALNEKLKGGKLGKPLILSKKQVAAKTRKSR